MAINKNTEQKSEWKEALEIVIRLAGRWIDSEEAREISSREQQAAIDKVIILKNNIDQILP